MEIAEQKVAARKAAFARRKTAFETVTYELSEALFERARNSSIIACYMPMRTEISPLKAMQQLVNGGKRVCVPMIQGSAKPLKFFEWKPDCELKIGAFGAAIPVGTKKLIPDFVVAPMVAFDEAGTRLGYGGGFYDRTIEELRQQNRVPYIGLAFEAQKASELLPKEPTDIVLDGVLTEAGYHNFPLINSLG